MLPLTLVVALAAAPGDIKIAAPDLEGVNLSAELRGFYTSHLGQRLQMEGLHVLTAADIRALIGQERQKQLLGCGDSESCAVEVGNALGADLLLTGTVAKLEKSYQINLKVMSGVDGKPQALYSGNAASEDQVLSELNRGAQSLAATLKGKSIPRRGLTSQERSARLLPSNEHREGNFIVRNDSTRELGRKLLLAGVIGLPVGLGLVWLGGGGALSVVGGVTAGLSLLALPVGLTLYFIGGEERIPVKAGAMAGDRNRFVGAGLRLVF